MEVVVPVAPLSAPCSPRTAGMIGGDRLAGYCCYFSSAPTSPSRGSYVADGGGGAGNGGGQAFDFAFGFSGQLRESTAVLAAADELFEGGRIRPLNGAYSSAPPAYDDASTASPGSPRRAREVGERGRPGRPAPVSTAAAPSRSRRAARSLSPLRGGGEDLYNASYSPPSPRTSLMRGCGSGSRKWRLKDLFLFRSASEGRAAGAAGCKDPLFKYTMLSSSPSSSSSSSSSSKFKNGGEGGASMRKGRGSAASASDMPYTINRAAAEEMRRRTTTPLPFHRNSLFGYLRSNPAIHTISKKLSSYSSTRARPN